MGGANGERVNEIAAGFNKSQTEYKVTPVFKGTYTDTMTAAIAAFRAGQQPHIVQVFEVGTATMMAAKGANRHLTLGLRPEHLPLADGRSGGLHVEVGLIEALGADTVVHGRMEGGAPLTVRLDGTLRVAAGDRLTIAPNPARLHLFDPDSGQRLGV